ncbi:MAG: hypothetical protein H6Q05_4425 [Acidobacteria bacterium]|nr:hypothetical protein [Acidobacteriota bacterium]
MKTHSDSQTHRAEGVFMAGVLLRIWKVPGRWRTRVRMVARREYRSGGPAVESKKREERI